MLKVNTKAGKTVFEQKLRSMIDSWHLTADKLIFQQNLSKNKITYVRLSEDQPPDVRQFELPSDIVIDRPFTGTVRADNRAKKRKIEESLGCK